MSSEKLKLFLLGLKRGSKILKTLVLFSFTWQICEDHTRNWLKSRKKKSEHLPTPGIEPGPRR